MIEPRLSQVFRTATSRKFYGIFSDTGDRFDGDDVRARRILRVNEKVTISSGSVISRGSDKYLLFLHSQAEGQKRFLAFQVTHHLPWVRQQKGTDPVTRMPRGEFPTPLDPSLPVVVEPTKIHDDLDMNRVRYTLRTKAGVEPGDKIGDLTVHTVRNVPGACILEAF